MSKTEKNTLNLELKNALDLEVNLRLFSILNVGGVSAASISALASYTAYDYSVCFNNGVEDVKLGGTVNSDSTVSVVTKKTGVFSVKRVIRAQSFVITQTVPRKIFTPNNDGTWDNFRIIFENQEGLSITNAKVYDLRGTEIAKLVSGTYNSNASLTRDEKKTVLWQNQVFISISLKPVINITTAHGFSQIEIGKQAKDIKARCAK